MPSVQYICKEISCLSIFSDSVAFCLGFDPGGGPWVGSIQRKVWGVGQAVNVKEVVRGLMGGQVTPGRKI
jgi:hypothetical protein